MKKKLDCSFPDYFSSVSANYAEFRPGYPIARVVALAAISPARNLVLDCGCGNGQLSILLAERFSNVIATDASSAQITNAHPHSRVVLPGGTC